MKNIKFYIKLALEYRLSLDNLCKIMGIDPTTENKKSLYDEILKNDHYVNNEVYEYLFNYETINESEQASNEAYSGAVTFIKYYLNYKNNDPELAKRILNKLDYTDQEYKKVEAKYSKYSNSIDLEDVKVISMYRLKYAVSRAEIADWLGVNVQMLRRREIELDDELLQEKLKKLNEYSEALKLKNVKGAIQRRC